MYIKKVIGYICGNESKDYLMKGRLPDYYVSEDEAKTQGWRNGKPPIKYVPSKMMTMGRYLNV